MDSRLRAESSATHRGCSGPAEGTKATDRVVLEEALTAYGTAAPGRLMEAIFKAARAHLATLPVKKWGVNSGYGWVHFDHLPDAVDALRVEALAGRAVTIEYRVQA